MNVFFKTCSCKRSLSLSLTLYSLNIICFVCFTVHHFSHIHTTNSWRTEFDFEYTAENGCVYVTKSYKTTTENEKNKIQQKKSKRTQDSAIAKWDDEIFSSYSSCSFVLFVSFLFFFLFSAFHLANKFNKSFHSSLFFLMTLTRSKFIQLIIQFIGTFIRNRTRIEH